MFRGSAPAKIDDKGRIKMPTAFRRQLVDQYGHEIFLTSIVGDSVLVYPLPVWQELESRLYGLPSTDRVRQRFLERVSYFGQQSKLDAQGRVVVPPLLRESAEMIGEKSAAFSEAPPTSAPSTFSAAKIVAALPGFTEPP